ncbi:MAG TPA: glycosyltransferase family 4 protein [Dermatophilaceae bacterium]|nr:glycosyltransferase family 4 protein [Dermatophilaceae bacterium]
MRALMVLGRSTGGIGAHVGALAEGLRRLGDDVRVVTDHSTAEHFGWSEAEHLWPLRSGAGILRAPIDWHLVMRRASAVDVVHAHGHQAAVVAAVAVMRARPRPRLVVSLHNDLPPNARRGPGARAVRWALGQADLVTGASRDLVELARSLGARRAELAVVASPRVAELLEPGAVLPAASLDLLGARSRLLAGVGETADRPLVLTVSRIAPQKELHTLVAAARASRADATWVVVGEGDAALRHQLENEARGIRLRFVGARSDVTDWMRSAQVFVLTSRWEARALVVQEAMAAGLPVVAPRAGGLPDLVGDAGVLVAPGDAAAVAGAVDRLLADPGEARRIGDLARKRAATWDTPATEARRWHERYTSLPEG